MAFGVVFGQVLKYRYMKYVNLFLAVVFTLFAAVQWNDPDILRWMAIYLLVAVVSGFAAFGRYYRYPILVGLGICLIWMASLVPDFIHWIRMGAPSITHEMKATQPHIELTREFLGLLLAGLALGWHWWRARKVGKW